MKSSIIYTTALILGAGMSAGAYATQAKILVGISEFHKVNADISRGARPSATDMADLKSACFTTIVNLENDPAAIAKEEEVASAVGMKEVTFPMEYKTPPTDSEVEAILAFLSKPSSGKIFVHCKHGQDRTGLIFGLYRIRHDHWTAAKAYQEMLDDHFHPGLHALSGYFKAHST